MGDTVPYIVVGARQGRQGYVVAGHARDIDSLEIIYRDGTMRNRPHRPQTGNPGRELQDLVDESYDGCEAIVIGEMEGPENARRRIINIRPGTPIDTVKKEYIDGDLIAATYEEQESGSGYGIPAQDGSGKGVRAQKGRNPACEEYQGIGKGSGTESGRASDGTPREHASEDDTDAGTDEEGA
ncbi:hypothetical protein JXB02_01575 [Candidatus Woesearchaeota archaeon]|nr:hypothetical protein [Candidatus Woesearchaeota archaeon]